MQIQMLTNILINIRIDSILSQYILSMIYVKAALSLSMCFLAPSLSYFPLLLHDAVAEKRATAVKRILDKNAAIRALQFHVALIWKNTLTKKTCHR